MNCSSFLPIISSILEYKIYKNDYSTAHNNHHHHSVDKNQITIFHSVNKPSISIRKYLERITKYAKCSDNQFILALIYIDRFIEHNSNFQLNSLNIHRLLISSIVISLKYDSDYFFNNSTYAKIGGISLKELNALEKEFLSKLHYHLYVDDNEFYFYQTELSKLALSLNHTTQM